MDMAVLVDAQGEMLDNIETQVIDHFALPTNNWTNMNWHMIDSNSTHQKSDTVDYCCSTSTWMV